MQVPGVAGSSCLWLGWKRAWCPVFAECSSLIDHDTPGVAGQFLLFPRVREPIVHCCSQASRMASRAWFSDAAADGWEAHVETLTSHLPDPSRRGRGLDPAMRNST